MIWGVFAAAVWVLWAPALSSVLDAQTPPVEVSVHVDDLECIREGENGAVTAHVDPERGGDTVRVYFRRLHHVTEDFYYVPARALGEGTYVGVLPKPQDKKLVKKELKSSRGDHRWAQWWKTKEEDLETRDPNDDLDDERVEREADVGKREKRTWMPGADEDLQRWLEALEYEPAEYYAAVFDSDGRQVGKSEMKVAPITSGCPAELGPWEAGRAEVLTVGETAPWQLGEQVFHWQCDGLVTRIDRHGIYRADEVCRACVFVLPVWLVGVTSAAGSGAILEATEPPVASPTRP